MTCTEFKSIATIRPEVDWYRNDQSALSHLNECAHCAAYAADIELVDRVLRSVQNVPIPADLRRAIEQIPVKSNRLPIHMNIVPETVFVCGVAGAAFLISKCSIGETAFLLQSIVSATMAGWIVFSILRYHVLPGR